MKKRILKFDFAKEFLGSSDAILSRKFGKEKKLHTLEIIFTNKQNERISQTFRSKRKGDLEGIAFQALKNQI